MQNTVQSIERVFDILELLSHESKGLNLTKIGVRLDLHKSTVHRLLSVLKKRGYIEKEEESGRYRLGPGFVELASLFLNSIELKTEAEPILRQLSQITGQTVFLAMLQGTEVVYLDKVEQYNSLRKYSIIGQRRPIFCTSLGKAMIMHRSNGEIRELLKDVTFERYRENTLQNIDSLLADLDACRRRGWTMDNEEFEPNIHCLGAPIFDYRGIVVAAVSAVWSTFNGSISFDLIAPHVVEAAHEISLRLGHTKLQEDVAVKLLKS
jgi:IclR family transcriptional regulator, KDG regulon repressor